MDLDEIRKLVVIAMFSDACDEVISSDRGNRLKFGAQAWVKNSINVRLDVSDSGIVSILSRRRPTSGAGLTPLFLHLENGSILNVL